MQKVSTRELRPRRQPKKFMAALIGTNFTTPIADLAEQKSYKLRRINFREKIISVIDTKSKIHEPKIYQKAISNLIHFR